MKSKTCTKCKQILDIINFHKQNGRKDGYYSYCKKCARIINREWQQKHPEKLREYNRKSWQKYREIKLKKDKVRVDKRHEFLDSLKTDCVKCGENRVWVIQFHHKDPKEKLFTICEGSNFHKSKESVIAEVKKTVCLCANCHKEYHYLYGLKSKTPIEDLQEYLNCGVNKK